MNPRVEVTESNTKWPSVGATTEGRDKRKVNQMSNTKNIRPIKPGQVVRSELDGTLGVTTSIRNRHGLITVMFVGSVGTTRFNAFELTVIDVSEVAA